MPDVPRHGRGLQSRRQRGQCVAFQGQCSAAKPSRRLPVPVGQWELPQGSCSGGHPARHATASQCGHPTRPCPQCAVITEPGGASCRPTGPWLALRPRHRLSPCCHSMRHSLRWERVFLSFSGKPLATKVIGRGWVV